MILKIKTTTLYISIKRAKDLEKVLLQVILAQYTLTMQISSICRSCSRHALRMSSRESVRLELLAGAVVLQFKQLIEAIHRDASALGTYFQL